MSTHAVLADALRHGFVQISSLALLVFDEAHHCIKKHPANAIMKDFYHPTKASQGSSAVPDILGLSASLIMRSNVTSMSIIETNLDAIGVAPRIHREDLLRHVHSPQSRLLLFRSDKNRSLGGAALRLRALFNRFDASIVKEQRISKQINNGSSVRWPERPDDRDTIAATIQAFYNKTETIFDNLGSWAADRFVNHTIQALEKTEEGCYDLLSKQQVSRKALISLLKEVRDPPSLNNDDKTVISETTNKVQTLISYLLEEQEDDPAGIVFVEQRATAVMLSELLQSHPRTRSRFRCASFVGTSNSPSRKVGLTELVDLRAQRDTLVKFRSGDYNLLVATNVLEEGIDAPSCNVVACFDPPANVKSFIQRRGRARHMRSRLGILVSETDDLQMMNRYEALEAELIRICQTDHSLISQTYDLESQEEDLDYEIVVPTTG